MVGVVSAGVALAGVARQPETAEQIGSTRNAKVAYPMGAERATLTFLAGGLSEEELAELKSAAPNVRIVTVASREEAMAHAAEAHGVDGRFATAEFIAKAPNLVWVQSMSAGVERFVALGPLVENDKIVLTNMRAAHGPAIADHAFAMLLTLTRGMRGHERDQARGVWGEGSDGARPIALSGRTMLVVGLGGIGGEVAQRAHGFGMRVIATRRTDTPAPEYIERVGGPGDLLAMLPEADVVAVCVPLTAETQKMFGAEAFAAMKPGSYLINVGRGRVVETVALVAALKSGRLAGACLDVTDPEPLPAGHELWGMENVVITPHSSADAPETERRRWVLYKENVRRFGAGEVLLNVVDKRAGY